MFHYIYSVHRKPNTDTSDYQGLGTPDPHPTGHSLFKLGLRADATADPSFGRLIARSGHFISFNNDAHISDITKKAPQEKRGFQRFEQ